MSGATGFIGSHLTKAFEGKGWQAIPLRRGDFDLGEEDFLKKIEGADVVISLAGSTIAARWTQEYKKIMYSSRIDTTKKIVNAILNMSKKPRLFVSTSAVGIYGEEGGVHTEESKNYSAEFLGKLSLDWEQAALKTKEAGVRTVIFRFGVVLGLGGGVLDKMLTPFRLGLGGTIGNGKQAFSWVHIEDLIRAYFTVIENETFEGIYNLTAPNPTTNAGLTKALAHALHKPAFMRIPDFILWMHLGEGAKAISKGQSVLPKRLLDSGFVFNFTRIEEAIEDLVKKV